MPLFLLAVFLIYSSYVGVAFSKKLRWHSSESIATSGLMITTGLAFAPFILGLFVVSALFFFPGYSASFHLLTVFLLLVLFHGLTTLMPLNTLPLVTRHPWTLSEIFLAGLLLFTICLLFFDSYYYLLSQNDALEYMTIARQLFITHDLLSYPMLNQEQTASGFYGPFTHPPLYVSLLYLMSIIQGHAKQPGLAKLVSPWFATVGCMLLTSLAATINRRTGLLAGLFFILTPLFFLGASAALIDPLPILGLLLPVTLYYALSDNFRLKWVVVGSGVGCGLWTHSEGVLILPLLFALIFLHNGFPNLRQSCFTCFVVLISALLIGIWPYVHNYNTLHAIISDNSRIFSLPQLEWSQYFSYARGLDTLTAKIQYGLFKGWSSPEAYGLTYFFMLLGFLKISSKNIYQMEKVEFSDRLPLIATAIVIMFLSVVFVSIAGGSVLIIKNERYFLLIQSMVCLLAAYGFDSYIRKKSKKLLTALLLLFVLLQLIPICVYKNLKGVACLTPSLLSTNARNLRIEDCSSKLKLQEPAIYQQLNTATKVPVHALIFSHHPANMYYVDRKMISYLDPKLEAFYNASSVTDAISALNALGITHIETSYYSLPSHTNSFVVKILEDPRLSTLVDSYHFFDIFSLRRATKHAVLIHDLTPGVVPWTVFSKINLIPRKPNLPSISDIKHSRVISNNDKLDFHQFLSVNQRHFSHILMVDAGDVLQPGEEYQLSFDLNGEGLVRLYSYVEDTFDDKTNVKHTKKKNIFNFHAFSLPHLVQMGELVLSKSRPFSHFSKRFYLPNKSLLIVIEVVGNASLKVDAVKLFKLEINKA